MVDGGARVVEITMTTPGALDHFRAIASEFEGEVHTAAGTVLDAASARAAIDAGVSVIVSPATIPEVIATAKRFGVACYPGAFTATECLTAMQAGADMVKIFPAARGGPAYMTNLKMVYPEVNLIPSGGINLDTAADYIQSGACAVSGARNFFNYEKVGHHGVSWVTEQVAKYIEIVARAKATAPPLP
jgi:2-dehydro-3-deoxyphosphogluconate aldolase/(4S)-4-hydroxy-2-oxoglutarate aldolase